MLWSSYLKFCKQCHLPSTFCSLTLKDRISLFTDQRYRNYYLRGKASLPSYAHPTVLKGPFWKTTLTKFKFPPPSQCPFLILPTLISDIFPILPSMNQIYFNLEIVRKDLRFVTYHISLLIKKNYWHIKFIKRFRREEQRKQAWTHQMCNI